MVNPSLAPSVGLSRAELFVRLKRRIAIARHVINPRLSRQLNQFRTDRSDRMFRNQDRDYPTVTHLDLVRAIQNGEITDSGQCLAPEPMWVLTVRGVSIDGHPLIVTAEMPDDEESPVRLISFVLEQP